MRKAEKFNCDIFMAAIRKMANTPVADPPRGKDLYSLLKLEGEAFVREAYRCILNREADPVGLRCYLPASRKLRGKTKILLLLLMSPERGALPVWQLRAILALKNIFRILRGKPTE